MSLQEAPHDRSVAKYCDVSPSWLLLGENMQTGTNGPLSAISPTLGNRGMVSSGCKWEEKSDAENKCGLALPCSKVYPPISHEVKIW